MPFSQQSYTGQGIVQQNVTPRAGEIIGASLANFGQSIGSGIEKFAQRKEERAELEKRQSGASKGMRDVLVNLGLMTKEQANSKGFEELMQISAAAPQLLQQQRQKQQSDYWSSYMQAQQPQEVSIPKQDFSGQIADTSEQISLLERMKPVQGTQPEGSMPTGESLWGVSTLPRRKSGTSPYEQAMASKAEQASGALSEIESQSTEIDAQIAPMVEELSKLRQQQEAELAKPDTRPESQAEYQKRIQDFMVEQIKKNPAAASFIADQMTGQKLTPEAQLSYMKYQDDINARTIPGLGVAPSAQTAKDLRDLHSAYEQVDTGVTRLLEILDTPGKRTNLDLRAEANTITGMLTGALRVPITGPGAFSDSEREMIEKIVQNPTSLWGLDSTKRKALETLRSRIKGSRDSFAKSIGLQPEGASTQTRMRYNPSTGKFE